jgi:hypothetical protein
MTGERHAADCDAPGRDDMHGCAGPPWPSVHTAFRKARTKKKKNSSQLSVNISG